MDDGSEEGKEKEERDKEIEKLKDIENEEQGVNRSCYTLQNVNFNVKKGQLIAVVGAVGSGKSSLLSGLLGKNIIVYYLDFLCLPTLQSSLKQRLMFEHSIFN